MEPPDRAEPEVYSLEALAEQARNDGAYQRAGKSARTLARGADMATVVTVLAKGAVLQPHKAPGPITVYAVSGCVDFKMRDTGTTHRLEQGDAVVCPPEAAHSVEALKDSTLLVVIGGRPDPLEQ